ncbi:DUF1553 domain-containing protein [Planctomicrobium piriforme]|uniref:Planctomycete cytochrome C n=1 Tax=Planctomicrobium piriforme TaxID=1576369 RepID=A0A1I3F031_9PLAN|nr:DUF1553 domain-containing protein [Planctomicrobium piriforme]SFI04500.1 Planctomycete cytochrome C [Planctomicrobium piriforme]
MKITETIRKRNRAGVLNGSVSLALLFFSLQVSADEQAVDFARDVAPILESHCLRCHSDNIQKGELSLSTVKDLLSKGHLSAGNPDTSYLIDMISPDGDAPPEMPKEGTPLSDQERETIRRWIQQGAVWPEAIVIKEKSKAGRDWWSLQPLKGVEPQLDPTLPAAWQSNPIDRFIAAELKVQGLTPSGPANPRDLIYRATYDLTGLPPTPEETAAFVADHSEQAYERLIDRLLASPRYGEQWGRHWLDVIRFGESRGFERNQIIDNLWPLRDYVIRSINEDKPFDLLIREHLTGDVIGKDQPDVEIAAAFLVAGPYDDVGNQDAVQAAQIRANTIDEIVSATSEAFLGLTVGCARCHDHKFDPILQQDYYSLYATFAGIHHGEREVASAGQRSSRQAILQPLTERRDQLTKEKTDLQTGIAARADAKAEEHAAKWTRPPASRQETIETFAPVEAKAVKLLVLAQEMNPIHITGYRIDEFEVWTAGENSRNVALAKNGGVAVGNNRVAQDAAGAYGPQLTIDGQYSARWVAAGNELVIQLREPQTIDRIIFSSDRPNLAPTTGDANFVSEYRILASSDGEKWTEVANSNDRKPVNDAHRKLRLLRLETTEEERQTQARLDRELAEVNKQIAAIPALPVWWVGNLKPAPGPFHLFLGGSPQRLGAPVTASSLSFLSEVAPKYQIENVRPEAGRRMALAEWIVSPQNPLTPRVLANRVWHYHFGTGIVETPSDFGYMGSRPTHPALLDWLALQLQQNGWKLKTLHRQIMLSQTYRQSSDTRAEAAQVDADSRYLWRFPPRRLAAEEIRDSLLQICGKLNLQMGGPGYRMYQYLSDNVSTYIPLDAFGPETYRRAVYHQNARASRIDLMTDFDSPDCAFATPRRAETTTPLQALTMLNHQFTLDLANALSERLQKEAPGPTDATVERAFALCFGRAPTQAESASCGEFIQAHGLPAFCRVMLNTSEMIYVK